jgi:AcrR family transcriptional regulator
VRTYRLKARAEQQEETRQRIVAAAVKLHESIGPLATTISAIAEKAGVERETVYRHFHDERSLFAACTEHYWGLHPPPDPAAWVSERSVAARAGTALPQIYAYWDEIEDLATAVSRDSERAPERVGNGMALLEERYVDSILADDGRARRARLVRATIALAVAFRTWKTLVREQGLAVRDAARLMHHIVRRIVRSASTR